MALSRCPSCGRFTEVVDPISVRLCLYKERLLTEPLAQAIEFAEPMLKKYAKQICDRIFLPRDVGKDAVQNALLNVMRKPHAYECPRPAAPWLKRIVRNQCYDLGRAMERKARRTERLAMLRDHDADEAHLLPTLENTLSSPSIHEPSRILSSIESLQRIDRILKSLRPSDRAIIEYQLEGLDPTEIAALLGLKYAAVTSRLFRIRTRIRKDLGDECA